MAYLFFCPFMLFELFWYFCQQKKNAVLKKEECCRFMKLIREALSLRIIWFFYGKIVRKIIEFKDCTSRRISRIYILAVIIISRM